MSSGDSLWSSGDTRNIGYIACRDHVGKGDVRDRLDTVWRRFAPYCAEADFLERVPREFSARAWELYLADWIFSNGFSLVKARAKGPDFHIVSPYEFFVEAVAVGPGETKGLPKRTGNRITQLQEEPVLLRYTSAFAAKSDVLLDYIAERVVPEYAPLVIAINAGQLRDADLLDQPLPLIVKALFPIGREYIAITPYSDDEPQSGLHERAVVEKQSGAKISTCAFSSEGHRHVSAVLFSSQAIWNAAPHAGRDMIAVHNPLAKSPLPLGCFRVRQELYVQGHNLIEHRAKH